MSTFDFFGWGDLDGASSDKFSVRKKKAKQVSEVSEKKWAGTTAFYLKCLRMRLLDTGVSMLKPCCRIASG